MLIKDTIRLKDPHGLPPSSAELAGEVLCLSSGEKSIVVASLGKTIDSLTEELRYSHNTIYEQSLRNARSALNKILNY